MNPLATASRPGSARASSSAGAPRADRFRTAGQRAVGPVLIVLLVAAVAGAVGAVASSLIDRPEFAVRPEVSALLTGVEPSVLAAVIWGLGAAVLTAAVTSLVLLLRDR